MRWGGIQLFMNMVIGNRGLFFDKSVKIQDDEKHNDEYQGPHQEKKQNTPFPLEMTFHVGGPLFGGLAHALFGWRNGSGTRHASPGNWQGKGI